MNRARTPTKQTSPEVSMVDKVCIVTGATGGMGRAIATALARSGATVVLVGRNAASAETVRREIIATTNNRRVEVLIGDLSDQAAIRQLAGEFSRRFEVLHVLVNNAGAHFRERAVSVDHIEMHLAVNHLAWFLLTNLLIDNLTAGAPSRVVNVGSQSMADSRQVKISRTPRPVTLDLSDLQSERGFDPMVVYARSKLEMVMCGYVLARRLRPCGVTVNTVHPGLAATGVVEAISSPVIRPFLGVVKKFLLTPEQGAQAALHLATAPELATVTGKYFIKQVEARSPDVSYDLRLQQQLWDASAALVGLPDDASHTLP